MLLSRRTCLVSVVVLSGCALTGLLVVAIFQRSTKKRRDPMGSIVSYIQRLLWCKTNETKSLKQADSLEYLKEQTEQLESKKDRKNQDNAIKNGIAAPTPTVKPVVIWWNGLAKSVHITGSFNEWQAHIPLTKANNGFSTKVTLSPGRHQFKFIVDDVWCCNEEYEMCDNGIGEKNNVIVV